MSLLRSFPRVPHELLNLPAKLMNRRLAFLRELPADAEAAGVVGLERQEEVGGAAVGQLLVRIGEDVGIQTRRHLRARLRARPQRIPYRAQAGGRRVGVGELFSAEGPRGGIHPFNAGPDAHVDPRECLCFAGGAF